MKYLFTLVALLGLWMPVQAKSYYTFSTSTGTYQELDDATVLTTSFDMAEYKPKLDINFSAFGKSFAADGEGISINTFGAIIGTNSADDRMFALDGFSVNDFKKRDASSSLSYKLDGEAGKHILKVQWKNVLPKGGDPATDYANFQLWLYEDGSKMEVYYGSTNISDPSKVYIMPDATGPGVGIFLSNMMFSQKYEVQYLMGDPASPTINRSDISVSLDAPPANGTVYTFEHKEVVVPPSLSLLSPLGGEVWKSGETHNIEWDAESISNIKIEYSTDQGNHWTLVADNIAASAKMYAWKVPGTVSNNCRVKLSDAANAAMSSESAFDFEIKKGFSAIEDAGAEPGISLYPNPARDAITVKMGKAGFVQLKIYAIDGKVIYNYSGYSSLEGIKIGLDGCLKGACIVEASQDGKTARQLIMKE